MSDLVRLRRADCGHGFLPAATEANALDPAGRELFLCHGCLTRDWHKNIETKVVPPVTLADVKAEQQRRGGR